MSFHLRDVHFYKTLSATADSIFHLMSEFIDCNTFFISITDKSESEFIKVFNRKNVLLTEGTKLPFEAIF
ncbi:hypothetical protein ACOI1C_21185 [Bacillus sp. DJP31]|uniref:hypothetical protein n=1 Tax=Bacillus sp. DJP31 TaxID=3409789 RepID=UPI003BB7D1C5